MQERLRVRCSCTKCELLLYDGVGIEAPSRVCCAIRRYAAKLRMRGKLRVAFLPRLDHPRARAAAVGRRTIAFRISELERPLEEQLFAARHELWHLKLKRLRKPKIYHDVLDFWALFGAEPPLHVEEGLRQIEEFLRPMSSPEVGSVVR